jgi:predicted nucleic acid-binding protein
VTVLVDTNILLDVLQRRTPFDVAAAQVWQRSESGSLAGFVAAISFNNVFYIARKQVGVSAAMDAVRAVRGAFRVVPLDEAVLDDGIVATTNDLEDAIQAVSARSISADYIVTRNAADFAAFGVPTATAEELLVLLAP